MDALETKRVIRVKINILSISVFFLAMLTMTGIATAMDTKIMDSTGVNPAPASMNLSQGQSIDLNFRGSNICANNACIPPLYLPVKAVIVPLNGGASSDLTITGIPMDPASISVGFNNPETLVPFSVKNVAAPPGKTYRVTIIAGDIQTSLDFGAASRSFSSIPEFPTVALPVGAALAIMFIMRRKNTEE